MNDHTSRKLSDPLPDEERSITIDYKIQPSHFMYAREQNNDNSGSLRHIKRKKLLVKSESYEIVPLPRDWGMYHVGTETYHQ